MKQERIRFEELDFIYPQHFLEINSFKIPIYAHIKNIRTKYVDEITIGENYDDFEFKRLRQVNISKLNYRYEQMKRNINVFKAKVESMMYSQLELLKDFNSEPEE